MSASLRDKLNIRMHGDPDQYYAVTLWEEEVEIACCNLDRTLTFIKEECTDEELYWLGEIYDDIMEKTHSAAFVEALRERVTHVDNPEWKASILEDIRTASEYIEEA